MRKITEKRSTLFSTVYNEYWVDDNNLKHGLYLQMNSIGSILSECTYIRGKRHGTFSKYGGLNNWITEEVEYKDGKKYGYEKLWHHNGMLSCLSHYKNDLLDGKQIKFSSSGKICLQQEFCGGRLHGKKILFRENGMRSEVSDYVRGVLILVREFDSDEKAAGVITRYKDGVMIPKSYIRKDGTLMYEYEEQECGPVVLQLYNFSGLDCILEKGKVIEVWKACSVDKKFVFVKLRVPAEAKRVSPLNIFGKGRIEYGEVMAIVDELGKEEFKSAVSFVHKGGKPFVYEMGKTVRSEGFDDSIFNDCGEGIHVHKYKEDCLLWKKFLV
ncbi:MAG: MORN repeat-containing protein [Harvfovirus sp.]|uniref:MORN repeat-containing protein n=1 Tax=Harvfovirus sp. TaxID=2487768 RepID=A0A3G5A3M6_9VIRU|nr:MAG: MORN repeat-containing protein [Harvfovirus sp.]